MQQQPNTHMLFLGPYHPLQSSDSGKHLRPSSISAQPRRAGNVNKQRKIKQQERKPGEEAEAEREADKREMRAKESKGVEGEGGSLEQRETRQ